MTIIIKRVIVGLKFLIPVLFLWIPFQAVWANYFLDVVDGDVLQALGMSEFSYQIIDKLADFWSYILMAVLGFGWQIRKTVLVLFIYRTIGQVLFFLTRNELVFFYFQNFLEPLVMIYTLILYKLKSEKKAYQVYKNHLKLIWGVILGYKLWNEWNLHFVNIDLSELFLGIGGG